MGMRAILIILAPDGLYVARCKAEGNMSFRWANIINVARKQSTLVLLLEETIQESKQGLKTNHSNFLCLSFNSQVHFWA